MDELKLGRATVETLFLRGRLLDKGLAPIPLFYADPPVYRRADWQNLELVNFGQLAMWSKTWPDAYNTGVLTRTMPMFNIGISDPEAAAAVEDLVRERFGEAGRVLVRFELPPKRGIPFRTSAPFPGPRLTFEGGHKLDFAGAKSHAIVAGHHPDTRMPVYWFGGMPGKGIALADLPPIDAAGAHELLASAARLLVDKHGLRSVALAPSRTAGHRVVVHAGVTTHDATWRAARWRELQSVSRRGA